MSGDPKNEANEGKRGKWLVKALFSIFLVLLGAVASPLLKDAPYIGEHLKETRKITWGHTTNTKVLDSGQVGGAPIEVNNVQINNLFLNEITVLNSGDMPLKEFHVSLTLSSENQDFQILGKPTHKIVNNDHVREYVYDVNNISIGKKQDKDLGNVYQRCHEFRIRCLDSDQELKITIITDQEVRRVLFETLDYEGLNIDTFEDIRKRQVRRAYLWEKTKKYIGYVFWAGVIILVVIAVILGIKEEREKKQKKDSLEDKDSDNEQNATLNEDESHK